MPTFLRRKKSVSSNAPSSSSASAPMPHIPAPIYAKYATTATTPFPSTSNTYSPSPLATTSFAVDERGRTRKLSASAERWEARLASEERQRTYSSSKERKYSLKAGIEQAAEKAGGLMGKARRSASIGRERTVSTESRASVAESGRVRTSSRAPAPFRPANAPAVVSSPHPLHHKRNLSLQSQYQPRPPSFEQPIYTPASHQQPHGLVQGYAFPSAGNAQAGPSSAPMRAREGPPLSPSARHAGGRGHGRSASASAVPSGYVSSPEASSSRTAATSKTPPAAASGYASSSGSAEAAGSRATGPSKAPATPSSGQASWTPGSVDKPQPPLPVEADDPPWTGPTGEDVVLNRNASMDRPRRKYSLLAALGLRDKSRERKGREEHRGDAGGDTEAKPSLPTPSSSRDRDARRPNPQGETRRSSSSGKNASSQTVASNMRMHGRAPSSSTTQQQKLPPVQIPSSPGTAHQQSSAPPGPQTPLSPSSSRHYLPTPASSKRQLPTASSSRSSHQYPPSAHSGRSSHQIPRAPSVGGSSVSVTSPRPSVHRKLPPSIDSLAEKDKEREKGTQRGRMASQGQPHDGAQLPLNLQSPPVSGPVSSASQNRRVDKDLPFPDGPASTYTQHQPPEPPAQESKSSQAPQLQGPGPTLIQGRARIFAAMADVNVDEVMEIPDTGYDVAQAVHYNEDSSNAAAAAGAEPGREQDAAVHDYAYTHTHGYPTPRSQSPPELLDFSRTRERNEHREHDRGRRQSQSLPPPERTRSPSPTRDDEREQEAKETRRPNKLVKRRGSSSSHQDRRTRSVDAPGEPLESEAESDTPSPTTQKARTGLGFVGIKMLTERQFEKLSTRATGGDAVAPAIAVARSLSAGGSSKSGEKEKEKERKWAKLRKRDRRGESAERGGGNPDVAMAQDEEAARGRDNREKRVEPPSPASPDEYARARARRRGARLEKSATEGLAGTGDGADRDREHKRKKSRPPKPYPFVRHLLTTPLLRGLLEHLSFAEWCVVGRVIKEVRVAMEQRRELRECVLERYLGTVGYARWAWEKLGDEQEQEEDGRKKGRGRRGEREPVALTLQDLNAYMRGVSVPQHRFNQLAMTYLRSPNDPEQVMLMNDLAAACRSYTRVVLRLRAQAEAEARYPPPPTSEPPVAYAGTSWSQDGHTAQPSRNPSLQRGTSRTPSRAPSPASVFSRTQSLTYGNTSRSRSVQSQGRAVHGFQSPLYRLGRAPLLRVFVVSEREWLSDASVLECEKELEKAGVKRLLRAGDVVWDIAVGDEGNVGRMVWDGSYLIDLDFTWSKIGDPPHYLPTLAFPPSYFHRVIRTAGSGNPICYVDISPWGEEIATNLQLIQDRVKTDTPQGSHHMVVRWVHRSSFTIRPSAPNKSLKIKVPPTVGPGPYPGGVWLIDPAWYGTVVVEAEGTNEGLADLQTRCGTAFPQRPAGASARASGEMVHGEPSFVFRILREKSRPGEVWIRTVRHKERVLPFP